MEISLNNLLIQNKDQKINIVSLNIPSNKIIGLYGNLKNNFLDSLVNDKYELFKNIYYIDKYNHFLTNYVQDELILYINNYSYYEKDIIDILHIFYINDDFLLKKISTLSLTERKIIKLVIAYFSEYKVIYINNLFNGVDSLYSNLFQDFIKKIKNKYHKLVFIHDINSDLIYSLVDRFMIIDTNLVIINYKNKVLENKNIELIKDFTIPKLYEFQKKLINKGYELKSCFTIDELIKEVKRNVC